MHLILACFLTVFGTLWTPDGGFALQVVNPTKSQVAHVTGVKVVALAAGKADDGDVPDPTNFIRTIVPISPAIVVRPGQTASITYNPGVAQDLLYDADAICEDPV